MEALYCVHGWEELTSSKYPYYPKQFIHSMKSIEIPMTYFTDKEQTFQNVYGTINDHK